MLYVRAELQRFCELEIKQIISLSENQRLAMFQKSSEIKIFLNMKNKHWHKHHAVNVFILASKRLENLSDTIMYHFQDRSPARAIRHENHAEIIMF